MSLDKSLTKNRQDSLTLDERYTLDDLAEEAGGYVSPPSEDDIAFVELLFTTSSGLEYTTIVRCPRKNRRLKMRQ